MIRPENDPKIRTGSGDNNDFATYFGYGSLVNRKTRPQNEPWQRATLTGWSRQWAHRADRPWQQSGHSNNFAGDFSGLGVSALTVKATPGSRIDGVLVPIAVADLAQLDAREAGYDRLEIPASEFIVDTPLTVETVIMYVSGAERSGWANHDYPLIQSYIDCVLDGFNALFGADGVDRFMATTEHWTLPLYNDRAQPLYPRAIALTDDQHRQHDQRLDQYDLNRMNHPVA